MDADALDSIRDESRWVIQGWVIRWWVIRWWAVRWWVIRGWAVRWWVIQGWVIRGCIAGAGIDVGCRHVGRVDHPVFGSQVLSVESNVMPSPTPVKR
jgi:hypothetical protein